MPVTAPRLADVGPGDPYPPVLGRRGKHLLQQLAVALLEFVALAEGDAGVRDPPGKGVPAVLQLPEPGDPRRSGGNLNSGVDRETGEGLGIKTCQLALEAPDLAAQLSPRQPLVAAYEKPILGQNAHAGPV